MATSSTSPRADPLRLTGGSGGGRKLRSGAHPSVAELGLVALVFAGLELALFGAHLANGGLYLDDWPIAAIAEWSGVGGLFDNLTTGNAGRPVAALYLALTAAISGTDGSLHSAWGLLTHLFEVVAVVWLLRALGLARRHVVPIGALVLLFPFADSIWLWYSTSYAGLSIGLAALGGTAALAGLRHRGPPAMLHHLPALSLFAASVLTYQIATLVICLTLVLYLPRVKRSMAVTLWLSDIVTVTGAALIPRAIAGGGGTVAASIIPLRDQLRHLRLLVDQTLSLLTGVLFPYGSPHRNVVVPVAGTLLILAAAAAWHLPGGDLARDELRRWLGRALLGGLVIAASYAIYVPAPIADYMPLGAGVGNRVNAGATVGFAVFVYSLAMLTSTGLLRLLRRPVAWAPLVALPIVTGIAVGYAQRVEVDIRNWDRAAASQRRQLAVLKRTSKPMPYTTLYAFGGVGSVASGVVAFGVTWDLDSAARLMWRDPTIHAYPILVGTKMVCERGSVVPSGPGNGDGPGQAASWGHAEFVDLKTGRTAQVVDRRTCADATRDFIPGH